MPPIPIRVVSSGGSGLATKGGLGIVRWAIKHWYLIIILVSLIPIIISSIQVAKETNNPFYPPLKLSQSIINADSQLYEEVTNLKEDPVEAIGMTKPEIGIYQKTKYFFKTLFFVWKLLGLIFLITLPFTILYKFLIKRNTSEVWKGIGKTIIWGSLFILITNLMIIVIQQASGNIIYTFPDVDVFQKAKLLLFWVFPFHGIVSLVVYLVSLI